MGSFVAEWQFLAAVGLQFFERDLRAGEDAVDDMLAGDIFNLSAAEVIGLRQLRGIFGWEFGQHGLPDVFHGLGAGAVELNLVEETALEGSVEILRQI